MFVQGSLINRHICDNSYYKIRKIGDDKYG